MDEQEINELVEKKVADILLRKTRPLIHQSDLIPRTIKNRHVDGVILETGVAADRPNGATHTKEWFSTDSGLLSVWDGDSWVSFYDTAIFEAEHESDGTHAAITADTVDTGQGANELYAMNQDVETTDAVTFLTVDTGQGANELYAMNQDVETTDAVTFLTVDTGQGANELY